MDNFMDKIAQKLSSQEAIRANSAADAAQIEKLEAQVEEYDACMKEMRKLNLKNIENEQKIKELLGNSIEQLNKLFNENSLRLKMLTEECIAKIQAAKGEEEKAAEETSLTEIKETAAANMAKLEELFKESDDFVHKENVKVYRNVQAVVVEELEKQTKVLMDSEMKAVNTNKKMDKSALAIGVITLVVSLANMGLLIAHILGVF
ncbi:hypothetical protein EDD76_101305 [Kineothrix alysoides]|uniref:Uncharacterized protein n=1 Tax=Kineothrix alysoides TaxID=1469948 RepID=A0A4R1R6Q2_9FIRM|nr:hypothetical protein [Kineothrix alysoides]TCL61208.1 hypothetical protein EDD76_101305 [Kineothrix alysoides]